jgi:hypothetical protein
MGSCSSGGFPGERHHRAPRARATGCPTTSRPRQCGASSISAHAPVPRGAGLRAVAPWRDRTVGSLPGGERAASSRALPGPIPQVCLRNGDQANRRDDLEAFLQTGKDVRGDAGQSRSGFLQGSASSGRPPQRDGKVVGRDGRLEIVENQSCCCAKETGKDSGCPPGSLGEPLREAGFGSQSHRVSKVCLRRFPLTDETGLSGGA